MSSRSILNIFAALAICSSTMFLSHCTEFEVWLHVRPGASNFYNGRVRIRCNKPGQRY